MSSNTSAPNPETIRAIEEVQTLKKDPNKQVYGSFDEILKELDEEPIPETKQNLS